MLLRLDNVSRQFAGDTLFHEVSLGVRPGDRIGLVGPNGAGKSTLLKMAAGDELPDSGRVEVPRGVRVGMLRQEIDPDLGHSPRDEVATVFARLDALEAELRELEAQMTRCGHEGREVPEGLAERYDRTRLAFEFGGGFERETRVERILEGLGFDSAARERPLSAFSGGWLMRVELAKLLLSAPDVLLLDEPTNHLDLPSIQWFEETLRDYGGAALIVSHDRTFLRRHVGRVAELTGGGLDVYEGNYERFLEQKALRHEQIEAQRRTQDRKRAEMERFVERFRYKATKARQAQSRLKMLEKMETIDAPGQARRAPRLRIPKPPRSGATVLRLEGIHKAYGDTRVYEGVDFQIGRGERVALAGPNGAGKSTLLRIAAGALPYDAGHRELGHAVRLAYFAQHQVEALDMGRTILEELESMARTDDLPRVRGHLGAFLFSGDDVKKKIGVLSGGEKARVALAKLLFYPANFLVLDEPTNHLDIEACGVLEDALRGYDGTLLFISHDRAFINALATRVVEVRYGVLSDHPGDYDHYLWRIAQQGEPAAGAGPAQAMPGEAPLSKQERIEARERDKQRERDERRARKRLARVESDIARLEEEVEHLGWKLADPEVFRDGEQVRSIEAERSALRERIDALYKDWEAVAGEIEDTENED